MSFSQLTDEELKALIETQNDMIKERKEKRLRKLDIEDTQEKLYKPLLSELRKGVQESQELKEIAKQQQEDFKKQLKLKQNKYKPIMDKPDDEEKEEEEDEGKDEEDEEEEKAEPYTPPNSNVVIEDGHILSNEPSPSRIAFLRQVLFEPPTKTKEDLIKHVRYKDRKKSRYGHLEIMYLFFVIVQKKEKNKHYQ